MKLVTAFLVTAFAATTLPGGTATAQTPGNSYYDSTPWPLPVEGGTSAFKLTGMTSAHAVWMSFTQYVGGKPVMDSPIITLLPGSTAQWSAPEGGCNYDLELVNANPPTINMKKPWSMCSLKPGAQVIFRILAAP
jgi:hypothetical protein